jgi:tetrahydromethanopterin S-methyltransferase subunit C
MNNFLAKTLTSINALIAVVIFAYFTLLGPILTGMPIIGLVLGAIVGVIVAALVCGTIAFLALIERHLAEIAAATRQPRL